MRRIKFNSSCTNDHMKNLQNLKFNQNGLIPAIAQDHVTNEVLMMAWMNEESLNLTLKTGFATYFSRSRNGLWKKGESSGNIQELVAISDECDFDCILLKVKQHGPACHTGKKSCFFNELK